MSQSGGNKMTGEISRFEWLELRTKRDIKLKQIERAQKMIQEMETLAKTDNHKQTIGYLRTVIEVY